METSGQMTGGGRQRLGIRVWPVCTSFPAHLLSRLGGLPSRGPVAWTEMRRRGLGDKKPVIQACEGDVCG